MELIPLLKSGGIIAYPTEAVYGLGCDALHEQAVLRICALKQRSVSKGVIIVAANWQQVQQFVQPLDEQQLAQLHRTWPGPVTWLLPASRLAPPWITGDHTSIAIRISAHPVVQQLCQLYNAPLVSTSANHQGEPPCRNAADVLHIFGNSVDYIVPGSIGELHEPTRIIDFATGNIVRE